MTQEIKKQETSGAAVVGEGRGSFRDGGSQRKEKAPACVTGAEVIRPGGKWVDHSSISHLRLNRCDPQHIHRRAPSYAERKRHGALVLAGCWSL